MEGRTSPFEGIVRCGIEQIREGLHPKWTIPFEGEVRPSTIYIYIYIDLFRAYHIIIISFKVKLFLFSPNLIKSETLFL